MDQATSMGLAPSLPPATDYPFGVGRGHFLIDGQDGFETAEGLVSTASVVTVNQLLAEAFGADRRFQALTKGRDIVALLACGSNASVSRMRDKLAEAPLPWAIGVRIRTEGFGSVYAATASAYGSIPATFADVSGPSCAFLIVTDRQNIQTLTNSETRSGNYDIYELIGERGLRLDVPIYAYLCRFGALRVNGELAALDDFALPGGTLPVLSQRDVLNWALKEARETVSPDEHAGQICKDRINRLKEQLRARREPVGLAGFQIVRFAPDNRVRIRQTLDRKRVSTQYEVLVSRSMRARLRLGDHAVLACLHPGLQHEARPSDDSRNDYLAVHCRVRAAEDFDVDLKGSVVMVDQTLRTALGIPYAPFNRLHDLPIFLIPASRSAWNDFREAVAGLFGYRTLVMRCAISAVKDIEKRYAKIPADSLRTLGIEEGGDVVLERAFPGTDTSGLIRSFVIKDIRLSAFSASDGFLTDRRLLARIFPDRYLDINRTLFNYKRFVDEDMLNPADAALATGEVAEGRRADDQVFEPDLPPIFLDGATRSFGSQKRGQENKANAFTALGVRRSVLSAIGRDIVQVGVAFTISMVQCVLGFAVIFPDAFAAREIRFGPIVMSDVGLVVATVLFCTIMTTLLTAIRLRQRI